MKSKRDLLPRDYPLPRSPLSLRFLLENTREKFVLRAVLNVLMYNTMLAVIPYKFVYNHRNLYFIIEEKIVEE